VLEIEIPKRNRLQFKLEAFELAGDALHRHSLHRLSRWFGNLTIRIAELRPEAPRLPLLLYGAPGHVRPQIKLDTKIRFATK
jgi:hypothetical protein